MLYNHVTFACNAPVVILCVSACVCQHYSGCTVLMIFPGQVSSLKPQNADILILIFVLMVDLSDGHVLCIFLILDSTSL